jgi:4-amino-4-deoxy-L-arabinose transferase-like glycosyltransferase
MTDNSFSTKKIIVVLSVAFAFIYFLPELGWTEFRWKEGLYSSIALEMDLTRPNTVAHGEVISSTYPLFPMMVSLVLKLGIPVSMAARFSSVICVVAISVAIWIAAARAYDIQTAAVSSAFFFSSMVVVEKGIDGYPEFLAFFLLLCAWFSWFTLGMQRGKWNIAWFVSFLFCGSAFYTIGWAALFYFFLPLVFMRRPLSIWSRMNKIGFYAGIVILAIFVIIWGYPRWAVAGQYLPFRNIGSDIGGGYIKQICFFLFDFAVRILPWTFVVLPVFCAAYDPIERNPVFARFLKTIFFTIFFLNWFLPGNDPRNYSLMLIPLSLLAGSHYAIFARRNGEKYQGLMRYSYYLFMFVSIGIAIFYIIPTSWLLDIFSFGKGSAFHSQHSIPGIVHGLFAFFVMVFVFRKSLKGKFSIFICLLSFSFVAMTFFWSVVIPYQSQGSPQREWAETLKNGIGGDFSQDIAVYLSPSPSLGGHVYGIFLYLGCKAKRLKKDLSELPENEKRVYLMSPDVPILPERLWTKAAKISLKKGDVYLWKGEITEKISNEKSQGKIDFNEKLEIFTNPE